MTDWTIRHDDELTVTDAAEIARCDGARIIASLREIGFRRLGHAPGEPADGLILIRRADLDAWIASR